MKWISNLKEYLRNKLWKFLSPKIIESIDEEIFKYFELKVGKITELLDAHYRNNVEMQVGVIIHKDETRLKTLHGAIKKTVNEFEMKIDSESFVNEVVERLNKKQLRAK